MTAQEYIDSQKLQDFTMKDHSYMRHDYLYVSKQVVEMWIHAAYTLGVNNTLNDISKTQHSIDY